MITIQNKGDKNNEKGTRSTPKRIAKNKPN